ncbi:MAG: M16 family metallopeptidase [bacterium JZ-2024 1]
MIRRISRLALVAALFCVAGTTEFSEIESRVVEFRLRNGLKVLVLNRGEAPVFSFRTYADVGGVDEEKGQTGLAHLFEHMAFKGTREIGTRDWREEARAIQEMEQVYLELRERRLRGEKGTAVEQLEKRFHELRQKAASYSIPNEWDRIVQENGGVGINAFTTSDSTQYFYSLPANRIELWAYLEAGRFADAVFREFYEERDVVLEERRLRTESSPFGRLYEEFLATAYKAHPYGAPVIGHRADISNVSLTDAQNFYRRYYGARNLVIAVVGKVDPAEVKRYAERYLTKIPAGEDPPGVVTQEPEQNAERRVVLSDVAQPVWMVGYHTTAFVHPDRPALDALAFILGQGRTSRLYKRLVKEDRLASSVSAGNGTPGDKYPGLLTITAFPVRGKTAEELEPVIYEEIEKMKSEGVRPDEIAKFRANARADFVRGLASNGGLAGQLTFFEVITGSWRNLFRELDLVESVTAEDVARVAREYLKPTNRTVALIRTEKREARSDGKDR